MFTGNPFVDGFITYAVMSAGWEFIKYCFGD